MLRVVEGKVVDVEIKKEDLEAINEGLIEMLDAFFIVTSTEEKALVNDLLDIKKRYRERA